MKAPTTPLITTLIVALATGCIPEKRIVWSPSGDRAAVATPNGLFFIDPDGKVLEPRLTGSPTRCDWFPDGRRLAVVHNTQAKTWTEASDLFSPEEIQRIESVAQRLRKRVLAYEGEWDKFDLDPDDKIPSQIEIGAVLYVRDKLSEGLPEKLGEEWDELGELHPDIWHLQLFTITEDTLEPGKVLVRTFNEIHQPKVAPNGLNVALLMPIADQPSDTGALQVVPAAGGDLRPVGESVAFGYDWSPNGQRLAFIHSSLNVQQSQQAQLGSLTTVTVAAEDGTLLKEWEQRQEKVGLLFNPMFSVRWLSDDRLLFSTVEMTLPATTQDMPQRWSLFVLDPKMPASVHRVLGRGFTEPLEPPMALFQVSPDEKRVLLPGPDGQVIVYHFADGDAKPLIDPETAKGDDLRSLPSWRKPSEICFVRPIVVEEGADDLGGEVVLWKNGDVKVLSNTWPDEMKDGWLRK